MKLLRGYPPNIRDIIRVFPKARHTGIVFAYGDRIYFNGAQPPPKSILAHEYAHGERQRHDGVEAWWARYLSEPQFCFDEEVIGHKAEAEYLRRHYPAHECVRYMNDVALKLSGPLYKRMCTFDEAIKLIEPLRVGI